MLKSKLFVAAAVALMLVLVGGLSQADPLAPAVDYIIKGTSDGIGWTWGLNDGVVNQGGAIPNGAVPNGGNELQLAQAWAASINAQNPPPTPVFTAAAFTAGGKTFLSITNNFNRPFTLSVDGTPVHYAPVTFNPMVAIYQAPYDIPTLTEWGLIILGVLLTAGVIWTFVRRRRVMVPA